MKVIMQVLGDSIDAGGKKSFVPWGSNLLVNVMRSLFEVREGEFLKEIGIGKSGITAVVYKPMKPSASAFTEDQIKAA